MLSSMHASQRAWMLLAAAATVEKNQCGQKGELGKLLPELALLSTLILLEYFYTKTRFSTPALRNLSALVGLAGQIYLS